MKRTVLLNPGPLTTSDAVKQALLVSDICPREKEFGILMDSVRQDLVKIVHGEKTHECVLFVSSGTGAVEACLTSLYEKNKSFLVINNGAYGKRIQNICDRFEISHIDLNCEWGEPVDLIQYESLLEQNTDSISAVVFVHHETTVGILNPLNEISDIAQKYKKTVIIDAMSSYAGIPMDVQKNKIHYLISSSNKCIQGMPGLSFVIGERASLEKIKNLNPKSYYFNLYENYIFQKEQKQFQFTPPVQVLYALRKAIDEYFEETEEGRFNRYSELYKSLIIGLKKMGFHFLVGEKHHSKLLTAILNPKDPKYNFNDMHDYLYERGFTIYPGKGTKEGTFRLANIGALCRKDIEEFLQHLKEYFIKFKINS
ncbi:MAG: 2-aminoethylphosphonate--pyruvate transaminase [Deltaproteobacteria bacterium]|nr:2-aminoethylphosphonate--pyruvate transaminase [Deltaproteobacteria bacterium]MBI3018128.1 2-aminoethylphosphonate--pyruvate transaminase [Deltaproteobacteria bacterium]